MTKFKFLHFVALFVALLIGFAALAHASFDEGKAAYDRGQGVPEDHAEAIKWYRKAADQGVPQAEYNLGLMYARGQAVAKDNVEALKWLRKAAEHGCAEAQRLLGAMYYLGQGVAKDDVEAAKWLNKATE